MLVYSGKSLDIYNLITLIVFSDGYEELRVCSQAVSAGVARERRQRVSRTFGGQQN